MSDLSRIGVAIDSELLEQFDNLIAKDLPAINKSLKQKKLQPIEPLSRKAWDAANSETDNGPVVTPSASRWERD